MDSDTALKLAGFALAVLVALAGIFVATWRTGSKVGALLERLGTLDKTVADHEDRLCDLEFGCVDQHGRRRRP